MYTVCIGMRNVFTIYTNAFKHWLAQDASIYAAALAYFTPFAVIPLLAVSIALIGLVVSEAVLVETLLRWGDALAPSITPVLADAVANFSWSNQYWGIPFVGVLVLSWVLLSTLSILVRGLHRIWNIADEGAWRQIELFLRSGLFFIMLLVFVTVLVATSIFAPELFGEKNAALLAQRTVVFFLTIVFFTTSFGVLARRPLQIRARLLGAFTIAFLFFLLRIVFGWWVTATPAIDLFGTAGVMLGLLLLIYAMTVVIYYGAAVAYIYDQQTVRGRL